MAIQKTKNLPNGTSGNYWRIEDIAINRPSLLVVVSVALYLDASHAASGAPNLGLVKHFRFNLLTSELTGSNIISTLYTKIRTQAETMISVVLNPGDDPIMREYDPDIAGGEMV